MNHENRKEECSRQMRKHAKKQENVGDEEMADRVSFQPIKEEVAGGNLKDKEQDVVADGLRPEEMSEAQGYEYRTEDRDLGGQKSFKELIREEDAQDADGASKDSTSDDTRASDGKEALQERKEEWK